ncbi:hypothetical protein C8Q76DRAFT_239828 [Earliella scabrosa]|nr:hypothetical protein C8Q76DRAFT_239828 [Earliella scabrosa]
MQQQRAEQEQVEAAKLHHSYIIDTSKPNPTSQRAQELVLLLCEGTEGSLNNRQCQNWVKYMKALGSNAPWEEGRHAFAMDNLSSLLARCERSHHHAHAAEFTKMLSQVQLVIKVDSIKKERGWKYHTEVYRALIADQDNHPSLRTFQSWITNGQRYAALAAAGSIYLLMVIAYRGLGSDFGGLLWEQTRIIAHNIRLPDASKMGLTIQHRLLPLLQLLAREAPMCMSTLFSTRLLERYELPRQINCTDLVTSDRLFCAINQLDFKLVPRKWDVWSSFFVPFPSSATSFNPSETMPPSFDYIQQRVLGTYTPSYLSAMDSETGSEYESPLSDSDDEHDHGDGESFSSHVESSTSSGSTYICIPTDYDPKHKDNLRAPYPPTQEGRDQWSYQQRACAALAYEPKNIDDLKARLQRRYDESGSELPGQNILFDKDSGVKEADQYVMIDAAKYDGYVHVQLIE